ncbi:nucleoid-associated protein YgaU [Arthrobacter pascens]|uniref:LysM peptidoglycan-binding domain-containing protein n=1 Tax=Arthrobacter pascens TaxID=1677 RepID=UPI0027903E4D|nr:LysM domain-containing protein [Arthrobacter pascens]MDQ0677439.1 nucleoid-associated protein YgaU [Arthrobacter pascens]
MGFLDDLKKNLGFGAKEVPHHNEPQPGVGLDANVTGGTPAPAPAPSTGAGTAEAPAEAPAEATTQQDAATRETAQQHAAEESAAAQQAAAAQAAADAVAAQGADPAPPVAPAPADQLTGVSEVVVEAGDTLAGIAVQFGVDLDALITANADTLPNPDMIYPGQVIRLP